MPEGWTLDTLKEYLDSKIIGLEKNVTTAMAAADKAVSKAEVSAEKRFDSVNEFRSAMKDQTTSFADKALTESRLNSIEKRIERAGGIVIGISVSASIVAGMLSATVEILLRH